MTAIEVLVLALVFVAVLRAARSAILALAGIISAGEVLIVSAASLRETIAMLYPRKRRARSRQRLQDDADAR